MKLITEIKVLEGIKALIIAKLKNYYSLVEYNTLLSTLTKENVVLDFPDLDALKKDVMIYIVQDNETLESQSMGSDFATLQGKIYIIVKGDNNLNLLKKINGYYNALYVMIRKNNTLDGFENFISISNMDFIPSTTEARSMMIMDITFNVEWLKWQDDRIV